MCGTSRATAEASTSITERSAACADGRSGSRVGCPGFPIERHIVKSKIINDGPQKTYVLVLDKGDEAVSCIEGFARENDIAAAQMTGIGAFSDAVLGFFDWESKD